MNTVASAIRALSQHITEPVTKKPDPVITFETKSHYGGPELVYVTSEHMKPLQDLTGSKTLADRHVSALKALGFSFEGK